MENIEPLSKIKEDFSAIKNPNVIHKSRLSSLDKLALTITEKVGSMGFFFICVILATVPLFLTSTLSVIQYISSGFLQLVLLPLIMVSLNLQGKHAELRAQHDFETNVKAEKEIETIILHLEKQDKVLLNILGKIEKMEKRK